MALSRIPGVRPILAALVAFAVVVGSAAANEYRIGDLVVVQPWTRATPAGAPVAGGYMRITNTGAVADRLVGGSSPAARTFELHEMAVVDGIMRMRPLAQGIAIAPGETVELRPGGLHVMFIGLNARLSAGQPIAGTLRFERAGTLEVSYTVEAMGAPGPGHGSHAPPRR